jgi:Domain of unknown function (DUF4062)
VADACTADKDELPGTDTMGQVSIRTPDQRLRVFVSSTLQELAAGRRAVREAIESLRLTPVMFEQGARPHPPRVLYRAYLEQSDVLIGLYWERYGWVAPGEEVTSPAGSLNTLDLLADLVDESLIRAAGEAGEPRFAMLETIREFAVERLQASGEAADYRARHQAHYLELAERGNAALGTADQVDWLDRLGRDNDNFRAVLRRAVRHDDAATAARMGRALATYWHMRGSYSEARGWMEQTATLPSAGPHERAVAWTVGAIQAFWQGESELLESGLDDALRFAG